MEFISRIKMRTRATGVPPAAKHAKGSYEVRWLAVRLNEIVRVVRLWIRLFLLFFI